MKTPKFSDEIVYDPVLRTYRASLTEHIYDVSGFFSPISIKDQIIRAQQIIDRAVLLGVLNKRKKLLIVGGGPAGIAAALRANKKRIHTVLVERRKGLGGHIESALRCFCPTQYDWPAPHWKKGRIVLEKTRNFAIEEGPAYNLIIGSGKRLKALDKESKSAKIGQAIFEIRIKEEAVLVKAKGRSSRKIEVSFYEAEDGPAKAAKVEETQKYLDSDAFDMILVCAGIPKERVTDKNFNLFAGIEFWVFDDHFKYAENKDKRILICGGGDGTLQDFLMLAVDGTRLTSKVKTAAYDPRKSITAKDIYRFLAIPKALMNDLEMSVLHGEEEARRKEIWYGKRGKKFAGNFCKIYSKLHKRIYEAQVKKLLKNKDIQSKLEHITRPIAQAGNIQIALSCDHFTQCYALNHFLALLIARYLEQEYNVKVILENHAAASVVSKATEHVCESKANICTEYQHEVFFLKSKCSRRSKFPADMPAKVYDTIFVRFGIYEIKPVLTEKGPALPGLQLLPFY